ncbi:MAG: ABC transporter ATP-binding protein [Desulfovibrio sp.]|jgi:capsular polysaccharide transport system ATP-binding protein|nr:ABC transporter ATP-binding protein [Desulfovibrio sp.]
MIVLDGISKSYRARNGNRLVLDDISRTFPPGVSVGILGRNGAGKSTLLRIIGGSEAPDSGTVRREKRISWPLGFGCGFNFKLTGRENLRFICRLYAEPYEKTVNFVEEFSELGIYLDMPIYTYSSGMRAKLAFGISMAFSFDYYLIDEVIGVGDAVFRKKSDAYFAERRKNATLLVVSHSMSTVKSLCDTLLVLHKGKLLDFTSKTEAESFYTAVCCA